MKRTLFRMSIFLVVLAYGCSLLQRGPIPEELQATGAAQTLAATQLTPAPTDTPPPTATPMPTSTPTLAPTSTKTPTYTPTPLYTLDLSGYDPDLFPPIEVSHNPPLIARSGETVRVVFETVNVFCMRFPISCIPEGVLYYTYGEAEKYRNIPLSYEIVNEMESLVASLPATDQDGQSLRYYVEFAVPEAGYTQRYPVEGTIDLFTTESFIPVELPVENAMKPGEKVYNFFWGYGPDEVRQATYEGYPQRVGPPAMDVADDGRIALMDPVNERIVIFYPDEGNYSSYPLPFTYGFFADLAFDPEGRLMVCDYQGEENEETIGPDPQCYLLLQDGKLGALTPVYVRSPSAMTQDLKIIDYSDFRLVTPFDSLGQANSREAQRQKETWNLPKRYVEDQYPFVALYADIKKGLAYEVHSASPLGALTDFEKTPQGYIMTFSLGDRIRVVWIDPTGLVLKDVTLPKGQYSEINFNGQVAITEDGSVYVLGSTERGIEIHFEGAP